MEIFIIFDKIDRQKYQKANKSLSPYFTKQGK